MLKLMTPFSNLHFVFLSVKQHKTSERSLSINNISHGGKIIVITLRKSNNNN